MNNLELKNRDLDVLWHPCTQMKDHETLPLIPIKKAHGIYLEDYYCYGAPVVAPADGTVVNIIDGIEDNNPGDINMSQNWGNTIIIKHTDYLYSQISHLKQDSFKVKIGDKYFKFSTTIELIS